MKRLIVALLVACVVLSFTVPALAKWVKIGTNQVGTWAVSDRVIAKQGDCTVTVAGVVFNKPRQTKWGLAIARKYKLRFCCGASTFQMLAYQLVGKKQKILYRGRGTAKAMKVNPNSLMGRMIRVHCPIGPSGSGPASSAPAQKKTKRPVAGNYISYKQTCQYCKRTGKVMLSCVCPDRTGKLHRTSINLQNCAMPVSNCNGLLTCGPCPMVEASK
ncbi:MAG: CVNH domain-containing protein [Proteobacteria bacterium]|nr:CVNH domain-containing protein [Pseudomonadota bacterium]